MFSYKHRKASPVIGGSLTFLWILHSAPPLNSTHIKVLEIINFLTRSWQLDQIEAHISAEEKYVILNISLSQLLPLDLKVANLLRKAYSLSNLPTVSLQALA